MQTAQNLARRLTGTDSPSLATLLHAPTPEPEDTRLQTIASAQATAGSLPIGTAQPKIYAPIPPFTIMKNMSVLAIFMALSYTFSFSLVAIGMMGGRIDDGKDNVGAAGLVVSYLNMVIMISLAGFYCVSAYVSEKWGELKKLNDDSISSGPDTAVARAEQIRVVKADISRIFKNSAIIGIPLAAFAILALIFSENVLKTLGNPADQSELAGSCLSVFSLGVVFYFIRMWLEQILFPFKEQKAAMFIGLVSLFAGVGIAYALCYIAGLGWPGIGLGFSLEPLLTSLGFGLYILFNKVFRDFNFFNNFTFGQEDITQIKTLVKGGWPITLTIGLEVIAMQAMTSIAGRMGPESLDAYTIASRPYFTALPLIIAFGQTNRQEAGRLYGEGDFLNMSRTAYYGLLATLSLILPFCITVVAYPELLITIMTGGEASEQVREMVTVMARIFALGVILPETVRYNWLNVITALSFFEQNMRGQVVPVIFSTGSLWLSVIVAWLLSSFTEAGIYTVPACLAVGITLGAALLGPQWFSKIRSYELRSHERGSSTYASGSINRDPNETTPLLGEQAVVTAAPSRPEPPYVPGYPSSLP